MADQSTPNLNVFVSPNLNVLPSLKMSELNLKTKWLRSGGNISDSDTDFLGGAAKCVSKKFASKRTQVGGQLRVQVLERYIAKKAELSMSHTQANIST
jgi:hypothetical protein